MMKNCCNSALSILTLKNHQTCKHIKRKMSKYKQNWYCPHCSQTSSRNWNLKKHIERKHQGVEQPIREYGWHSIPTATDPNISTVATHFIPDMTGFHNNNSYDLNHQRYTQTFSASQYSKKEEDTSKKRDALDEFLEF